jgi:hypothetical protein
MKCGTVHAHRRSGRRRAPLDAGVYRYDQLVVLRSTPAVLLEAGSIVNRQEELELAFQSNSFFEKWAI